MVVLLKHRNRTYGQKVLLPLGCEGWLIIYLGVGGGKEKGWLSLISVCLWLRS